MYHSYRCGRSRRLSCGRPVWTTARCRISEIGTNSFWFAPDAPGECFPGSCPDLDGRQFDCRCSIAMAPRSSGRAQPANVAKAEQPLNGWGLLSPPAQRVRFRNRCRIAEAASTKPSGPVGQWGKMLGMPDPFPPSARCRPAPHARVQLVPAGASRFQHVLHVGQCCADLFGNWSMAAFSGQRIDRNRVR